MEKITNKEIKEIIGSKFLGDVSYRKLIRTELKNSPGKAKTILFSIEGSPPKGYAMYIPELRRLNFYDGYGKRFKIKKKCEIEE